jgi:hypothetical protein
MSGSLFSDTDEEDDHSFVESDEESEHESSEDESDDDPEVKLKEEKTPETSKRKGAPVKKPKSKSTKSSKSSSSGMPVRREAFECPVCTDSSVYWHKCPCGFAACWTCWQRYLLENALSNPRCMNTTCRMPLTYRRLLESVGKTFVRTVYRVARGRLALLQSKSHVPEAQTYYGAQKVYMQAEHKKKELWAELKLKNKIDALIPMVTENSPVQHLPSSPEDIQRRLGLLEIYMGQTMEYDKVRQISEDAWKNTYGWILQNKRHQTTQSKRLWDEPCSQPNCRGYVSVKHRCCQVCNMVACR